MDGQENRKVSRASRIIAARVKKCAGWTAAFRGNFGGIPARGGASTSARKPGRTSLVTCQNVEWWMGLVPSTIHFRSFQLHRKELASRCFLAAALDNLENRLTVFLGPSPPGLLVAPHDRGTRNAQHPPNN